MLSWLTPTRAATITGALIGLAGFITGNIGVLPKGWENAALAVAGLLTAAAHLITYIIGGIHWQGTPAGQAQYSVTADGPGDPDALAHVPTTTSPVPPDEGDPGRPDPAGAPAQTAPAAPAAPPVAS